MASTDHNTTVALVRRRLIDLIRAQTVGQGANGTDVMVMDAMIADSRSTDDIHIGDVREWTQELQYSRGSDRHKRDESYTVDINIFVARQDAEEANEQALALWDLVDGILASHPDLQLEIPTLVVGKTREGTLNMTYDESQRGWRSRVYQRVSVTAKIR